jgi:hypothetical protein
MDNAKGIPLSVMLENARKMTASAVQEVLDQTKLPAYLFEGILVGLLSDIREQKNAELIADIHMMHQEEQKDETEKEGEK